MFRVDKIDGYISTPSRELHMIGNYKLAHLLGLDQ